MELDAHHVQRRMLRTLTRAERLDLVGRLMALAIQLRDVRYRRRYPDLTSKQRTRRCLEDAIAALTESVP